MRFGPRTYLVIVLTGVALVAAPEFLVRPYRGFAREDVSRIGASMEGSNPSPDAGNRPRGVAGEDRLAAGMKRERAVRNAQTTVVVALFGASVLFLARNLRGALRLRRDPRQL